MQPLRIRVHASLLTLKETAPRTCGEAACSVSMRSRNKNVCDLADHSADNTAELCMLKTSASYSGLRIAHVGRGSVHCVHMVLGQILYEVEE